MDKEMFFGVEKALGEYNAAIEIRQHVQPAEALKLLQGAKYKVVAHFVNCVRFGYYEAGKFNFADGAALEEKYLVQLRVFNAEEEVYLQKQGAGFYLQYINDAAGSEKLPTVDSASQFFGHRVAGAAPQGFAELWEAGRKIRLVLPVAEQADEYKLLTRSYVQFDEKTGQAGYAYYRWLDIVPADGRDE